MLLGRLAIASSLSSSMVVYRDIPSRLLIVTYCNYSWRGHRWDRQERAYHTTMIDRLNGCLSEVVWGGCDYQSQANHYVKMLSQMNVTINKWRWQSTRGWGGMMWYIGRLVSMASMQRSITSMLFATPMYLCMLFNVGEGLAWKEIKHNIHSNLEEVCFCGSIKYRDESDSSCFNWE